ncbi:MurR/RpiR family transcriptional regulator [Streptococcus thoraltensis]|uniref:MurR/RpiR family transcriptional regulator n=1 Tax=Streptococcus thoraltensis TaxID=55085 RepID=UPI00037A0679|nr:MurR/RpiR family transcriptional regulator [Streptococcus thoraltensis]MDY4761578.1 MurR/RpiR family transcriptional regulator [Streptococcus thoraltensis]
MKFNDRVLNVENNLTDLEDMIVNYIEKNKEEVSRQKITALADQFYTVPNTLTRLCHKLGYEGFVDLKNNLKQELLSKKSQVYLETDSYIFETIKSIDDKRLKKCITVFKKSKAVTFFAVGQTGELTKICTNNFYAFDPKFNFLEYPNTVNQKIGLAKDEAFFFVSLSGESKETIKLAKKAKSKNQTVISLTGMTKNSLSQIADISLYCYLKEENIDGYDITDKTPIMIVLNRLFHLFLELKTGRE